MSVQHERTGLAWVRTSFSLVIALTVLVRLGPVNSAFARSLICVIALTAVLATVGARRRQASLAILQRDRLNSPPPTVYVAVLAAAMTVAATSALLLSLL